MFSKNRDIFLLFPVLLLNFLFIFGFILIYIKTISTNVNLYENLLNNSDFFASLLYGLKISFFTLLLSVVLYFIIYYLLFLLKFKYAQSPKSWFFFICIPILIPYSFCAFLMFLMFFPVGFLKDFVPFLVGTSYSVVIAYTYKVIPFFILISFPNLLKISQNEINFHKIYSSNSFCFFWNILVKRNVSVLFIGGFIVLAYVFNAYEIPSVLGSNIDNMPAIFVNELLGQYGENSVNFAYASSLLYFVVTLGLAPFFFFSYKTIQRRVF